MSGPQPGAAWLRAQVLLLLLVPALSAALGQPMTTVVAAVAVTLLSATVAVLVTTRPAGAVTVAGVRLRAWGRAQGEIRRAEEPGRAGRPHPRAPGAGSAAPEL